jgi:tRNA A-37 threonylcarbamoyl transferase component Bud32
VSKGDDDVEIAVTSDYTDPLIGRDFKEKYRIRSKLGEGGFGTVYRAIQLVVGREVAVKVLRPDRAADEQLRDTLIRRFRREAVAMSKLAHPNTVQLIDFGTTDDDILYLVLELLSGLELSQVVATQAPMRPSRVAHICRQMCLSLAEAHTHGIIHRDLKPGNVFLCHVAGEDDHVKVMDFGIARVIEAEDAKITKTGMTQGTPAYMAPEQAMALETTPASDLYSMACMFYEMLTGVLPFTGESTVAVSLAHVKDRPPTLVVPNASAELSARWDALFQDLVKKKTGQRIQSATEVAERLAELVKLPDPGLEAVGAIDAFDQTAAAMPIALDAERQDELLTEMSVGAGQVIEEVATEMDLPEIRRSSGRAWIAGAVVATGLAIWGLATTTSDQGVDEPEASPAAAQLPPAAAAPTPPAAPAVAHPVAAAQSAPAPIAPSLAHLVLATEPSGALVYRRDGDEESLVCSTPCDVRVPAGSEKETLILRAKGHRDRSLEVDLSAEAQVVLAVNLDPKKAKRAKRRRTSGGRAAPGRAGAPRAGPAALPRLRTGAPKALPRLRTGTSP